MTETALLSLKHVHTVHQVAKVSHYDKETRSYMFSYSYFAKKLLNICSKQQLFCYISTYHVFSPVSFDFYWDQSLEVSPMCLSASQTLAHKINSVFRQRRVFSLSVCPILIMSQYAASQKHL